MELKKNRCSGDFFSLISPGKNRGRGFAADAGNMRVLVGLSITCC